MMPAENQKIIFQPATPCNLGQLSGAGFIRKQNEFPWKKMRILGSYALVYVLEGSGHYLDTNGLSHSVRKGDLLLLFPELGHSYGPGMEETWTEFYVVFDGPVFDPWRKSELLVHERILFPLLPVDYWLKKLLEIVGPAKRTDASQVYFAQSSLPQVCLLQKFLAEMIEQVDRGVRYAHPHWIEKACHYLSVHLKDTVDFQRLAHTLNVSYETFRKEFKRATGMSPGRYHATQVIQKACQMMLQEERSNKEIAEALGFCDEFHFSKRFKEITGASPKQYRKQFPFSH